MPIRSLPDEEILAFAKSVDDFDMNRLKALGCANVQRVPLRIAYYRTGGLEPSEGPASSTDVLGGLSGEIFGSCLYVRLLWVDQNVRGKAVGSALMRRAEQEAYAQGCSNILVDTHNIQAEGFYPKLGYRPYARLSGAFGNRATRICFSKPVAPQYVNDLASDLLNLLLNPFG